MALGASWGIIIFAVLFAFVVSQYGTVHCKPFYWDDATLMHPSLPESFPTWFLLVTSMLPVAVAAWICRVAPIFPGSALWEFHEYALTVALANALVIGCVVPTKLYAGRLRPDFILRLNTAGYNSTFPDPATTDYCGITDPDVREGRLSFPSERASMAFTAAALLAVFCINRFRVLKRGSLAAASFIVCSLPFFLAAMVALSQTRTDRHYFSDIVAGAVLGVLGSMLSFRLQYTFDERRECWIPTTFLRLRERQVDLGNGQTHTSNMVPIAYLPEDESTHPLKEEDVIVQFE